MKQGINSAKQILRKKVKCHENMDEGYKGYKAMLNIYISGAESVYDHILSGSIGKIDLNIDTKEFVTGLYFVSLQTPTIRKVEQLVVFK